MRPLRIPADGLRTEQTGRRDNDRSTLVQAGVLGLPWHEVALRGHHAAQYHHHQPGAGENDDDAIAAIAMVTSPPAAQSAGVILANASTPMRNVVFDGVRVVGIPPSRSL